MKLSDFKMLTFDTYGTLIDWESGIYNGLGPLLDKLPINLSRDEVLELFAEYERQQQADHPQQLYSSVLADVSRAMAKKWQLKISDDEAFDLWSLGQALARVRRLCRKPEVSAPALPDGDRDQLRSHQLHG